MSVKEKYQPVLDLGQELGIKNGNVTEENGILSISGTANTPYERNIIWDKIKEIGGAELTDVRASIKVEDETVFHKHTVASGETLSKIALKYYGNAGKYPQIFEANTDILKDANTIHPNQLLIIPNE
ncbi:MAG: peptidoglycan-binding protein [Fluviicola sp.]|nr:MAG: peptidoglycan-binding protein [Fluviicola sp.]